ncbi:MAG: HU family DNA-binding protein [Desulfobulbus sp.]|nr:HU family DNA-binding protein [Desulfobulbus sp.]
MNKTELVKVLQQKLGLPSKANAEVVYDAFFEAISAALKAEGTVRVQGFGTFSLSTRKERMGRNPRTGETVLIPAKTAVKFSPSLNLKKNVAGEDVNGM